MNLTPGTSDRPTAPISADNLRAVWRRLRLVLRRDPVAAVTSPAAAVRLADETLALVAVGRVAAVPEPEVPTVANAPQGLARRPPPFGAQVWTGLAVEPLAALLCAASPIGAGRGVAWLRDTAVGLHAAEPDNPTWDCALRSSPRGAGHLRAALADLRGLDTGQRRSVTHAMVAAAERLHR